MSQPAQGPEGQRDLTIMTIRDYQGQMIKLTPRQWNHALERHPYMAGLQWTIEETLEDPEEIRKSSSDPGSVKLYYRRFPNTRLRDKWVCVTVKFLENDAFILTVYPVEEIREGALIWRKE